LRQDEIVTTPTTAGARRRHRLVAAAVAALLALAVFWYLTPNAAKNVRATHAPAAVIAPRCPTTEVELRPWTSGDGTGEQAGSVPAGFSPRSVLLCSVDFADSDARSKRRYAISTTESPVSSDLISALQLPDQEFWFDSRGACFAAAEAPLHLLLLDAQRRAVRPVVPVDPCGTVRPELRRAIAALPLVETGRMVI
jgi:hypothetical protein